MPDPLLLDWPETLESGRLIIRVPRPGDGASLYQAVAESIDTLRAFPASTPWAMAQPSIENSELYCRSAFANFVALKDLPLLLIDRATGAVAGASGLHRPDWELRKFELGFWCRTSFQNQGLATEAALAILTFAFDTLRATRVEALADELNAASCRVCEKAGMVLEGTLRHAGADPDGTPRNMRLYAKVR